MRSGRVLAIVSVAMLCGLRCAVAADGGLEITVTDVNGKPLPCRIHVLDAAGKGRYPAGLPHFRDHFVCPGKATLNLEAGDYTVEIERRPEYERFRRQSTILADKTTRNAATLRASPTWRPRVGSPASCTCIGPSRTCRC